MKQIVFVLLIIPALAFATGKNEPAPVKMQQAQQQAQQQAVEVVTDVANNIANDSASSSEALATSDAASMSDALSTSDNAVAISNVYMSRAFAQDFPITHGCFVGLNAGGDKTTQTKSTGGFLGFTYLSNSCHMQALAAAEKDVDIVARLQCADRKYRKALAFDANDYGQSKRERCIDIKKQSLMGAIEQEKQRLNDAIVDANKRHSDVENLLVIEQEHKEVCDEGLKRCTEEVQGYK